MSVVRMAAVAAPFDRDLEADFARIEKLLAEARAQGVGMLALPEAALGGYLANLDGGAEGPPPLRLDGPEIARLAALAGDMVVTAGYCEDTGERLYNSAVCVCGDGVLGNHRKVHQPLSEHSNYGAGGEFTAFDTPVGRLGMDVAVNHGLNIPLQTNDDRAQVLGVLSDSAVRLGPIVRAPHAGARLPGPSRRSSTRRSGPSPSLAPAPIQAQRSRHTGTRVRVTTFVATRTPPLTLTLSPHAGRGGSEFRRGSRRLVAS